MTAAAIAAPPQDVASLAQPGLGAMVPDNVRDCERMAAALAKSSMLPGSFRGNGADIFAAICCGLELGLPPLAALRGIVILQGKPTLRADTMVGLILASGRARFFHCVTSSRARAVYETQRLDADKPVKKSFGLAEATTAKILDQDLYRRFPRQTREARAKAWLARDQYPDVVQGLYAYEELVDERPREPEPAGPRPAAPMRRPLAEIEASLHAVETPTELAELAIEISGITKTEPRTHMRRLYDEVAAKLAAAQGVSR